MSSSSVKSSNTGSQKSPLAQGKTITSSRDAFMYLGIIIIFVISIVQISVGTNIGIVINDINRSSEVLSYTIILIGGLFLLLISFAALFRTRLPYKISIGWYSLISLVELLLMMFMAPKGTVDESDLQTANYIGLVGLILIFYAIRPNYGPEANKRIYQAVAGILAFVISIFMIILGLYLHNGFNIADYAGRGTYPTIFDKNAFVNIYLSESGVTGGLALEEYNALLQSGTFMIIGALIIMGASLIRNRIGLIISGILFLVGAGFFIGGVISFGYYWNQIDIIFSTFPEYRTQLKIIDKDPGISSVGGVLFILQLIATTLMFYASFAAKPIDAWRSKRDQSIAAAEVATREGRLPQAVKYLEVAAMYSSKIDEEDRAIELLTRVKQIKDKEIKMRKAVAAEKAKKDYEKAKKAEMRSDMRAKAKEEPSKPKKID